MHEGPGLFLALRRGLPLALAGTALALAVALPGLRGWALLAAVALLAEVGPTFRRGAAYLRTRPATARWDGLWVRALRPVFRRMGRDRDLVLSFCAWNNARVLEALTPRRAQRALMLLPHCIQMAACRAPILEAPEACRRCGLCAVGDALEACLAHRWDLRISNRSHKAYREARDFGADLVVAVSCPDRLLKGLTRLVDVPAYAIPLDLPHGWCVDTRFDISRLIEAMEALVEPKAGRDAKIRPLERGHSA